MVTIDFSRDQSHGMLQMKQEIFTFLKYETTNEIGNNEGKMHNFQPKLHVFKFSIERVPQHNFLKYFQFILYVLNSKVSVLSDVYDRYMCEKLGRLRLTLFLLCSLEGTLLDTHSDYLLPIFGTPSSQQMRLVLASYPERLFPTSRSITFDLQIYL